MILPYVIFKTNWHDNNFVHWVPELYNKEIPLQNFHTTDGTIKSIPCVAGNKLDPNVLQNNTNKWAHKKHMKAFFANAFDLVKLVFTLADLLCIAS